LSAHTALIFLRNSRLLENSDEQATGNQREKADNENSGAAAVHELTPFFIEPPPDSAL
jgi:hypothetical protein